MHYAADKVLPLGSSRNGMDCWGGEISIASLPNLFPRIIENKIDYSWTKTQASRFISSILLGIPIPCIYIAIVDDNNFILNGWQRIRTIVDFTKGNSEILAAAYHSDSPLHYIQQDNDTISFNDLSTMEMDRYLATSLHSVLVRLSSSYDIQRTLFDITSRINPKAQERIHRELLAYHEIKNRN